MGNAAYCNCNNKEDNEEMNMAHSQLADNSSSNENEDSIIIYSEQMSMSKRSVGKTFNYIRKGNRRIRKCIEK
jgi:hypothetical protein